MQIKAPRGSQRMGMMSRAAIFGIATAAVLMATGGTTAMAASHDDYKGWFVSLDAAITQPNGLDQQVVNIVDPTTGITTRQVMNTKSAFTWALQTGYSWGELGGLAVSYWSFDNEETKDAYVPSGLVYPTVFGAYGYNNGGVYSFTGPGRYKAISRTKAITIDLDYYRPMHAGEKLTVNWITGLRSATFEEDRSFDGSGGGFEIIQTHDMKSDAFGVKVGAKVTFGFTEHFSLQGTMAYSFLQAHTNADASDNAGGRVDQIEASDDHVMGEIRDYDVRAVWSWNHLDLYVGFGGQTWEGLVADPIEGSCCGASGAGRSTRDSVAFNSAHGGVTFRFGGGTH